MSDFCGEAGLPDFDAPSSSTPAPTTSAAGEATPEDVLRYYLNREESRLSSDSRSHDASAIEALRSALSSLAALREQLERQSEHAIAIARVLGFTGAVTIQEVLIRIETLLAALRQKDEALEEEGRWLVGLLDYVKGNGDRPPSLWGVEEYLTERCRRPNPALAIQPDSSAPNAVIDAATAKLREILSVIVAEVSTGHTFKGGKVTEYHGRVSPETYEKALAAASTQNRNLSLDSPSKQTTGVSVTKESGAPSGQTAGVASQKAGQP
jgi:hypothetical protein